MPGPRLPMRRIRDVLRLSAAGMSKRQIAASLGVSATAAGECIRRARRAGLAWPLPDELSDEELERRLYPLPTAAKDRRPRPDWAAIYRELRRPGVTLQLLWEEHRAVHSDGYGYSRFCELYRAWEARLLPTMRQNHIAGERMFVDYAGTTLTVIDASTGEARTAQLFVAGCIELHLCGGDLDAGPVRLDRRPHARLCVCRRGPDDGGVRQSALGHYQGLLLRATGQSDLRGHGGALRHCHHPGAALSGPR